MSGDRLDRELDAFLERDGGELGRLYRKLPQGEPPRRLDRAILAEAARAVRGADGRRPPRQRWLLGLGSVAGVVLAAGIAWQVQRETAPVPATAPASEFSAPPGVISVQPIVPPAAAPVPSPAPAVSATQSVSAPAESAATVRRERAPAAEAEAPPRTQRKAAPPPAPPPPPAAPARAEVDAAADALEAPPPAAAPAAAAPQPPAATAEDAARSRTGALASPAPITSSELRRNMRLPPEVWLDEIRRMQRDGQYHWAGENLRLYRRVHPRRAIPADLQPLLED